MDLLVPQRQHFSFQRFLFVMHKIDDPNTFYRCYKFNEKYRLLDSTAVLLRHCCNLKGHKDLNSLAIICQ